MEWQCDGEAASGERALASAPGWCCPAALARLEPGDEPVATGRRFATRRGRDPLPRTTRAVSSRLARAIGSQCASANGWPGDDQAVRCPRRLGRLARFGDSVNFAIGCLLVASARTGLPLRVKPHDLFPGLLISFRLFIWPSIWYTLFVCHHRQDWARRVSIIRFHERSEQEWINHDRRRINRRLCR